MLKRNTALGLAVVWLTAVGALADPALYWGSHTAFTGVAAANPDIVGPDGVELPSGSTWLIQLLDLDSGNVLFSAPAGSITAIGPGVPYGVFYTTIADVGPRRGYSVGARIFNSDSEATASRWAMFSNTTTLAWNTVPTAPATVAYDAGQVAPGDWREFATNRHTVTFLPGAHGSLAGGTPAVTLAVNHGDLAPAAPAVTPTTGWLFTGWLPLLPATITEASTTTAQYEPAGAVLPTGVFLARVEATAVAARGLWDLTGSYPTTVKGNPLTLNLVHDPSGRLSGTATYTVAPYSPISMPIKGGVKGTRGSVTMKGSLKGTDAAQLVSVSLLLNLTVDTANRQLAGRLTGSIKSNGTTTPVDDPVVLNMLGNMDGTWTLSLDVDQSGRTVTGTAELKLSNDVKHTFVVRGKTGANNTAVLSLAGDPSNPAAKAITVKTTITPLEGGQARIESFAGRGYGQTVGW
jgi:hypothetical protein